MSVSENVAAGKRAASVDEQVKGRSLSTALRRRAAGLSLLGAGALTFAGFLVTPWEGPGGTRADLRTIATHAGQAQVAALLLISATCCWFRPPSRLRIFPAGAQAG